LFIGAHDDVVIPLHHIESMKAHVENLEVHVLRPCGHWTQQERADDVNTLIIDWLSKHSPA
jgi:pimeloyl-ACP methyl ester carboxylesterase